MPAGRFSPRRRNAARDGPGRRERFRAFLGLKDLREGLAATFFTSTGSLLVGLVFAAARDRLEMFPVLLVLIPAVISTRGHIFGALGSRLGSQLHLGLITPHWRRSKALDQNFVAALTLSLLMSLVAGFGSYVVSRALGGGGALTATDLALVSAIAGLVSGFILFAASLLTAFVTFTRGLNPDNFTAPLLTLAGDVVALPLILGALEIVLVMPPELRLALGAVSFVLALAGLAFTLLHGSMRPHARRVIAESTPTFMLAAGFSLLAGSVLLTRVDALLARSGIITLVPAFLVTGGGIGAILAANFASGLHVGRLEVGALPPRGTHPWFLISHVLGLVAFSLLGLLAWLLNLAAHIPTPPLLSLVVLAVVAGQIVLLGANLFAYYASTAAFRMGLDPDNVVIPILTSTMDLVGTLSLVVVATFLGVL